MRSGLSRRRWLQGLAVGCVIAAAVLLAWSNNVFARLRLEMTDIFFTPAAVSDSIVIVAIDDASLSRYGRSPAEWSRALYAALVDRMAEAGARVVAFDLLFSEPTASDLALAAAIQAARRGDGRLRTVMASAGSYPASRAEGLAGYPQALQFAGAMEPVRSFSDVVDYLGIANTFPDVDGTVRRQASVVQIGDQTRMAWSLAVYLAYLRIPAAAASQVVLAGEGRLRVAESRVLAVDDNGFWLQNFYGLPSTVERHTFPVVSFADVIADRIPAATFADKIVLVGLIHSAGITDRYVTPASAQGQLMTGVEIQANAIETLIQNQPLKPQAAPWQALAILGLALGSSLIYIYLRWSLRLAVWAGLLGAWFILAFALFSTDHLVVNLLDPVLAMTLPVVVTTGVEITAEIARRRRSEFLLQSLVKVSQQRLLLDRVLPYIGEDIHQIVPGARVVLWRCDRNRANPEEIYHWPEETDGASSDLVLLAQQVVTSGRTTVQRGQAAIPVAWRQRLVAILAVQTPEGKPLSDYALTLLRDLARELAPSLENTFLYTDLERQNAIQESILAGSPAGVLVLDRQFRVLLINSIFGALFGITPEAYLGEELPELWAGLKFHDRECGEVDQALRAGEPFRLEMPLGDKTFSLDAAPQPEFGLWVLVLTDVTHLIQLSQLKTTMIRMLSHDLGNPLSRVLGYSHLLLQERETLSEMQQTFLENILGDGEEMDRIITDVLNLEHLRSGELVRERFDLRQVVADLVARQASVLAMAHQTSEVVTGDEPVLVDANRLQLGQAITNLVANAIKYSPDGGHIRVAVTPAEPRRVRVAVADNGCGIPEAAQPKIFTEFFRVKTAATAGIRGTGLGLSLVKVVVEKHGGRVWFESQEGVGSTFMIELPRVDSEQGQE